MKIANLRKDKAMDAFGFEEVIISPLNCLQCVLQILAYGLAIEKAIGKLNLTLSPAHSNLPPNQPENENANNVIPK